MGGGHTQLSAYGSQDIYITNIPDITYFKSVIKRHTNFAMESVNQAVDGNVNFGGNTTILIARNGDLVGDISLQVSLFDPKDYIVNGNNYDYCGWIQGVGNYLINSATITIGGQQIDQQYGKWMDIWSELSLQGSQVNGYGKMIGKDYNSSIWHPYNVANQPSNTLHIPLQFWFCRNPGLALPMIAFQFTEVKITLQFEKFTNLVVGIKNGKYQPIVQNTRLRLPSFKQTFSAWVTYYFLDTTERLNFVNNPHEYLIEQIQCQSGNLSSIVDENIINLNISHPTKEIIFVLNRNNSNAPINDFSMGGDIIPNGPSSQFAPIELFKLLMNGNDRAKQRPGEYFRLEQNYNHHTRIPDNYIYTYSFSLRPEEHQPSGTCNMSRIDNTQLYFLLRNTSRNTNFVAPAQNYQNVPTYTLYAPCYNIFRVMGGMVGMAYNT